MFNIIKATSQKLSLEKSCYRNPFFHNLIIPLLNTARLLINSLDKQKPWNQQTGSLIIYMKFINSNVELCKGRIASGYKTCFITQVNCRILRNHASTEYKQYPNLFIFKSKRNGTNFILINYIIQIQPLNHLI